MKRPFISMHARTFCHATENLDRVRRALENTAGKADVEISRTEGHHGNLIAVLEIGNQEMRHIDDFFSRLGQEDIEELLGSLGSRIDDDCNFFLRIDKQSAYEGNVRLARNDDAVSVRLRVGAFPAKWEAANAAVKEYLEEVLSKKR